MKTFQRENYGYSMVELLLVLVIVGVLAIVGVMTLGNNRSGSVRGVMDELEGTLSAAQASSVATGRDVMVVTAGEWSGAVTPGLRLAYGDASLGAATVLTNGATAAETFKVAVNQAGGLEREHMNAAVVTKSNSGWWATAATGSASITSVDPFKGTDVFNGVIVDTNNLFQGGTAPNSVRISGINKRFVTTFWIEVVAIRGGQPIPGGPMGLLLVAAGGAQVFRFYNPGILNGGNGTWRRI